jgi:hypothetical protein
MQVTRDAPTRLEGPYAAARAATGTFSLADCGDGSATVLADGRPRAIVGVERLRALPPSVSLRRYAA